MSNRILRAALLVFLCLTIAPRAGRGGQEAQHHGKRSLRFRLARPPAALARRHARRLCAGDGERKEGRLRHFHLADADRRRRTGPAIDERSARCGGKLGARWKVSRLQSRRGKGGQKEPPQLCLLPMVGGDAFVFTDLPKGAGDPTWSPDGKSILFTSTSNPEDLAKQAREEKEGRRAEEGRPRGKFARREEGRKPESPSKERRRTRKRRARHHPGRLSRQ